MSQGLLLSRRHFEKREDPGDEVVNQSNYLVFGFGLERFSIECPCVESNSRFALVLLYFAL